MAQLLQWARRLFLPIGLGWVVATASGASDEEKRLINDCGVNALYLLLRLQAVDVDLGQLRQALPDTSANPLSMADLQSVARRYGVSLRGRRINFQATVIDRPSIALLRSNDGRGHFVVLEPIGSQGTMVKILDFPRPIHVVDFASLAKSSAWTGLILVPATIWENLSPWVACGTGSLLLGLTSLLVWLDKVKDRRNGDLAIEGIS